MSASTGPSARAIAKVVIVVAVVVGLLYLAYLIRGVLELVFIAAFLAVAIGPVVVFFGLHIVRPSRTIAVVYLLLAGSFLAIGLPILPPAFKQVDGLPNDIPRYLPHL